MKKFYQSSVDASARRAAAVKSATLRHYTKSRAGAPDVRKSTITKASRFIGNPARTGVMIDRAYGPGYTHRRGMVHFST